jgi:hypothetical protein
VSLSTDNIIQQATGSFEGASGTVSLPVATTAGSLVLICVALASDSSVASTSLKTNVPTGGAGTFVALANSRSGGNTRAAVDIHAQRNVAAGETSWTLAVASGTPQVTWSVFELFGVGLDPYDTWYVTCNFCSDANSLVSSTTHDIYAPQSGTTTCLETLGISVFAATSADTTAPVISTYTMNHLSTSVAQESTQVAQDGRANATCAMSLGVAFTSVLETDGFTAAAAVSPNSYLSCAQVVLYADGARFRPDYVWIFGAEIGTATNLSVGSAAVTGTAPFNVVVGTPEIVTTHPRSGTYGLKLSSTSAAESCAKTLADLGITTRTWSERFHCYFETSLPGVDVELYSVEAGSLANGVVITYRTASQKIGVKIGTGTEVLSDTVVAADKHIGVDFRYDTRATTHTCDWQVDYDSLDTSAPPVAQTKASTSGMTAADITTVRTGWTTAITATVFYDDLVSASTFGVYPIGDQRIVPLKVDPAGTPSIVGTTANFNTFVNNGTMSAWSGTDARARLANIPPIVGASASGVAQVTAAGSDYMLIPMETFVSAPTSSPRAARAYLAGWAKSALAATIAVRMWDETGTPVEPSSIQSALDHGFDDVSLRWICFMIRPESDPGYLYTQAHVDAFALQLGLSGDATPDVGFCGALVELCVTPAQTFVSSEVESGAFKSYMRVDPVTQATRGFLVTTPSGTRGATMMWTVDGVDHTQYVGPNTAVDVTVGADVISQLSGSGLLADPA